MRKIIVRSNERSDSIPTSTSFTSRSWTWRCRSYSRGLNKSPGARLCRVVTWDWDTRCLRRVGAADDDDIEIREGWEESKALDTEWWRRLLCGDYNLERPKYLPGDVFKLGSMRGSWHGKEYVSTPCLFLLPA
jgi:hypothetical protein